MTEYVPVRLRKSTLEKLRQFKKKGDSDDVVNRILKMLFEKKTGLLESKEQAIEKLKEYDLWDEERNRPRCWFMAVGEYKIYCGYKLQHFAKPFVIDDLAWCQTCLHLRIAEY